MVNLSLENSRRLNVNSSGYLEVEPSLLEKYAKREQYLDKYPNIELMNFNLTEFATHFESLKTTIRARQNPKDVAIRFFQNYSPNPQNDTYPLFCKFRLLRYKPWQDAPESVFEDYENNEDGWVQAWQDFLRSDAAKVLIYSLYSLKRLLLNSRQSTKRKKYQLGRHCFKTPKRIWRHTRKRLIWESWTRK